MLGSVPRLDPGGPGGPGSGAAGAARAYAVRVALDVTVVVRAGLDTLLAPLVDRVEVVAEGERSTAHVEVFDPDEHPAQALVGLPRVALIRDRSPGTVARARDLGAVRVLPLSVAVTDLVHAVEQVHRGGVEVPSRSAATACAAVGEVLSPREADVVAGICRGLSNTEIAEELYLSINSVKTYVRTAYRKMGVASRSQAVLWGVTRGL